MFTRTQQSLFTGYKVMDFLFTGYKVMDFVLWGNLIYSNKCNSGSAKILHFEPQLVNLRIRYNVSQLLENDSNYGP